VSDGLKIELKQVDGKEVVFFSGAIDEDSDFSSLDGKLKSEVIFDLNEIELINSCGIRDWIKFQDTLESSLKIIYRNCPQVIIEQMNIVKGFVKAGGEIESFYAPYYDENADKEYKLILSPSEVINGKAPIKKNEDGEELDFDDIEAQYFNFLKNS